MDKYKIVICWSEADMAYIVKAPELAGCMADGATEEAALSNIEAAIREWIETAKEMGRPIPKPEGKS